MNHQSAICSYIIYNHWANKRLSGWLKALDRALLYKKTNASFASIDLTLQHIKNAQNFWYAVITKGDPDGLNETIQIESIDTVIEELLTGSEMMVARYTGYTEEELMARVTSPVMEKTRYEFILHVVNHNSYHRGQIVTIARNLGAVENIPETDFEAFLWFEGRNIKT